MRVSVVFLLDEDERRRSAGVCSSQMPLLGWLDVDLAHERWGKRVLRACLWSHPGRGSLLAELHQVELGSVAERMVLSGVEEIFGRRGRDRQLRRQAWSVSLLDRPLSLLLLRERGRRLELHEFAVERGTAGVLSVDAAHGGWGRGAMRALFYDAVRATAIATLDNARLRRIASRGMVLQGVEECWGHRQRERTLYRQAWWLAPSAPLQPAGPSQLDVDEEREQLAFAGVE
jgi:hypothetical protein